MENLLKWSLAQQGDNQEARERAGSPDPRAIAELLGLMQGKDDPTVMKESAGVLDDPRATWEQKRRALQNMEALIENLDNANNLKSMGLWKSVLKQLYSEDPQLQALACSCIGSAVQNNKKSQDGFLELCQGHDNAFTQIMELAENSDHDSVRIKAFYALSNLTRHNQSAYKLFEGSDGWRLVSQVLNSNRSSKKLKLRTLSLISSLLSEESEDGEIKIAPDRMQKLQDEAVVESMVKVLRSDGDLNCIDRAMYILNTLVSSGYPFSQTERNEISNRVNNLDPISDRLNEYDLQSLKSVF